MSQEQNEKVLPDLATSPNAAGESAGQSTSTSDNWASLVAEQIEEVLFGLDKEWRFTFLNRKATQVLGKAAEALLGRVLWEEFPTLLGSSFEALYRQAMQSGQADQLEDFSPTSQAWFEVRVYPVPQGLIVYFRDISERKNLEQTSQESEYRFKVLSECSFEGVALHRQGLIIEANQSAAQMFGYDNVKELIKLPITQLTAPESLPEVQNRLVTNSEEPYETIALRKDGTTFPIEVRGKTVEYYGERARVIVLRDITERKQAEETLRKTQTQLLQAQKMESVGRLVGGIAHDFNNLLTAISGYAELILMQLDPQNPLYADLSEIEKSVDKAASLIRQLLAFSRQQILQPAVLNLNEVVATMDKLLRRLLGEDIELVTLTEPALNTVLADPSQIEQVIVNLAVNARDAMPDGGKLTIETANVELDEHYRAAGHPIIKSGPYVMLAVSDNGIGMDEALQEKIFEPFFTTKGVGKGTGLGLATVQGIVEQSGGYIWVYSEVGVGTSFKIYLPRVRALPLAERVAPLPAVARQIAANQNGATILLVEDDQLVRELIHQILTRHAYQVLEAANGQEALSVLSENLDQIDLILTDIIMPGMGGRELISKVRAQKPDIRIICMSGYTDQAVTRHNLLQECNSILQKPFTPTILIERIETALGKGG